MDGASWSSTTLGPVNQWPTSLNTALCAVLAHRMPMPVLWAEKFLQLYNDAYRSVSDAKHPHVLRRLCKETCREAWDTVESVIRGAYHTH